MTLLFIKIKIFSRVIPAVDLVVPDARVLEIKTAQYIFNTITAGFGDMDKNAFVLMGDHERFAQFYWNSHSVIKFLSFLNIDFLYLLR